MSVAPGLLERRNMKHRLTTFILAGLALAAAGLAIALTGGSFNLPSTAILTGGDRTAGGGKVNVSAIGGYGTAMAGGTLTMTSGTLASVKTARTDLSLAHVYPTPFMPSSGHDRITFTQLPVRVVIKIYTISGRLVRTLDKDDSADSFVWFPVTNEQGAPLASGVYPFTLAQPGIGTKRGKIMVIK